MTSDTKITWPQRARLKSTRLHPLRALSLSLVALFFVALLCTRPVFDSLAHDASTQPAYVNREFERAYGHVLQRDCASSMPLSSGSITSTQVGTSALSYLTYMPTGRTPLKRVRLEGPVRVMMSFNRSALLLDVGANVGRISFPTLAMPQRHRVISVEPVKNTVRWLCRTATLNGYNHHPRLTLVNAAFSSSDATMEIFIPKRADNAAISRVASTSHIGGGSRREVIHTVAGDRFLELGGLRPDVIKVDTQGHELQVLRGLRRYLRDARPLVIAESDPQLMSDSGVNPKDVYRLMVRELGYTPFYSVRLVEIDGKLTVRGTVMHEAEYPTARPRDIYYWKA